MIFLKRSWPILIIIVLLFLALFFNLPHYLSWSTFQNYHAELMTWSNENRLLSVVSYMLIYTISVAVSIPGATILTLIGGFLFGPIWGTLYVVVSATVGALLVFLAVKYFLGDWASKQARGWVKKMQQGFANNALSYLLILRLIPLFPFWVVNIVPAILNIDGRVYFLATFLGIIPGSLVYVSLGDGVSHLFELGKKPDLSIIFAPQILLPLFGLAILSLLPVLYQQYKRKTGNESNKEI